MPNLAINIKYHGFAEVASFFENLPREITEDLMDLWTAGIGPALAKSFKRTFEEHGRSPAWSPLTAEYAKKKDSMLRRSAFMDYPVGRRWVKFGSSVIGRLTGVLFAAMTAGARGDSSPPGAVRAYTAKSMFWGCDLGILPHAGFFKQDREFERLFTEDMTAFNNAAAKFVWKKTKALRDRTNAPVTVTGP